MKYLENLINRLEELNIGVEMNREFWNGLPSDINKHIAELRKMDKEIEDIREALSKKLSEARKLRDEKRDEVIKIERRAVGLHADYESKLKDYNILI